MGIISASADSSYAQTEVSCLVYKPVELALRQLVRLIKVQDDKMKIFKKIIFIPFLIISMVSVVVFADQLLLDPLAMVIGFEISSLWTLLYLSISLLLTALFFALTVSLSLSWEIPLFASGFASLIPLMMIQQYPINLIFAGGFFLSFLVGLFNLLLKLKSYLTFSPRQLLGPSIGLIGLLFCLTISVAAYQKVQTKIDKEGFTVPQQLIDFAVQFSGVNSMGTPSVSETDNVKGESTMIAQAQINLSPEQIELIRKNPQLLQQFGITPQQFEAFVKSQNKGTSTPTNKRTSPAPKGTVSTTPTASDGTSDLVGALIKNQLNETLKPYSGYMAPMAGLLVFSTISFFNYLLGFFMPLLLWIIFSILEKTGFVHFEKEMREVKKLVV